ncbi:type II toxin-antitoxin system RelE/ParE family toxin [Anabaena aphanizomenioides LEGE 00250]|jgi:toxin ParE1/3/4|uniref:Type II toxin-antitoxin system RelE/ParE family toxin n=1 Tax=Sphaerospermopsis aphanizomenoides LEGE 00250 TaxID=2777972 RepID=A0ABR9VA22_9CYAN|nr:type II toxin-antitoxin system RelE/ParE family toxin [Sphaerospermopsis aphanizomenoides]MBE9234972.1 type II toxin-antitoxin system RelE/ParE family toxin [Sphaerospermopsis aphanizomenoides LEGE 00250]
MTYLLRTAQAEEDLIEIWLYIAADNQVVADKILDQIEEKSQLLAKNPGIGQARPDIAPEMRYFPVGSYLILYREIKDGIEVVRVVHGARNLPDVFS